MHRMSPSFNSPCLDEERPNATNASEWSALKILVQVKDNIYGGMYVPVKDMTREETPNLSGPRRKNASPTQSRIINISIKYDGTMK